MWWYILEFIGLGILFFVLGAAVTFPMQYRHHMAMRKLRGVPTESFRSYVIGNLRFALTCGKRF